MLNFRRSIALLFFAVAIASCADKAKTAQDSTKAGQDSLMSLTPEMMLAPAEDTGLVGPPTQNSANTYVYVNALHWDEGGQADSSTFTAKFACPKCTEDSVELRIVPSKRAYKTDWPTAFVNRDNRGWIVAKIQNLSKTTKFLPLDLDPDSLAYQWVGPIDNSGKLRGVAFYKINVENGVADSAMSVSTKIQYCTVPNWKKRKNSAAHPAHPTEATDCVDDKHATATKVRILGFPSDGTWLSCVGGCCKVQAETL